MITAYSLSVYKIIKSLLNSCFRKLFKLKILIIGHLRDKQSVNHTACLSNRLLFLAANKMEHSYYYTNGICTCTYVTTTNWLNNIISRWREIWPFSSTDFSQGWVFLSFDETKVKCMDLETLSGIDNFQHLCIISSWTTRLSFIIVPEVSPLYNQPTNIYMMCIYVCNFFTMRFKFIIFLTIYMYLVVFIIIEWRFYKYIHWQYICTTVPCK